MKSTTRLFVGVPVALGITLGLGQLMIGLIHTDGFVLAAKKTDIGFAINPKIEDIKITKRRKPEKLRKIETPPAAPVIERTPAAKPQDGYVIKSDYIPPTEVLPDIRKFNPDVVVDVEVTPLFRVPPAMPIQAQRSGHCVVAFDVGANGSPFNIQIKSCSQTMFARPTIRSVAKWKYRPKVTDGQTVIRRGLQTIVTFNLTDERGRMIPE